MGYSVAAIVALGLICGRETMWRRPSKGFIVLQVVAILTLPFVLLSQAFGDVSVVSLIFHVNFGVEGVGLAGFERQLLHGILLVFFVVFSAFSIGNIANWPRTTYSAAIVGLLYVNPLTSYIVHYGSSQSVESDIHDRIITPEVTNTSTQPDIILVYLEGVERSFALTDVFGDVFAPLLAYEQKGVSFTAVRQVYGTEWSLGGMVANLCGVPLAPRGLRRHFDLAEVEDFLKPVTCLPDLLAEMGYNNSLVVGGGQGFAGFGHFFASHQIKNVFDRPIIQARVSSEDYASALHAGLVDDQMVFDVAMEVYDQSTAEPKPLFLVVETNGPHGSASVLSRNCTSTGRADSAPNVARAVQCTLGDTDRFLDHISANHAGRDTLIIVASDHLNHDPGIKRQFSVTDSSNTIIMYWLGVNSALVPNGSKIDREATMFDVFPSILAYVDLVDRHAQGGLGRSLFGDDSTLIEEKGMAGLNAELFPNPLLSQAIWGKGD